MASLWQDRGARKAQGSHARLRPERDRALGKERASQQAREELERRLLQVRSATEALCAELSPEDAALQSMPLASPAKWHLAHTSWFFETFVVAPGSTSYRPFNPEFRVLFNSYYQQVGQQHPRPQRGLLTRPSLDEVFLAITGHVVQDELEDLEEDQTRERRTA